MTELVPAGLVEARICMIRSHKVMLDADLAVLYGVETKALNRAVRRNLSRFPKDFMFLLTSMEQKVLRCQFGTSNSRRGGRRYLTLAFTEQGVAMLSGILNSPRAVQVNIAIMRAFMRMRQILADHRGLARRLDALERRLTDHDAVLGEQGKEIRAVFNAIQQFLEPPSDERQAIGFKPPKGG